MNLDEQEKQEPETTIVDSNDQKKIKTVARKTAQGKAKQAENKAVQKKEKELFKATLKDKKDL